METQYIDIMNSTAFPQYFKPEEGFVFPREDLQKFGIYPAMYQCTTDFGDDFVNVNFTNGI